MSNLDYSNIPNLGKKTLEDSEEGLWPREMQNTQVKGINNAEELRYTQSYQKKNSFPCFLPLHSKSHDLQNIGYFFFKL